MAARSRQRNESWHESVRKRIQASNILTRMHGIAEGKITGDPKRLAVQVRAGAVLLAKVLPDLSSVTMTNDGEGPFRVIIEQLPPK